MPGLFLIGALNKVIGRHEVTLSVILKWTRIMLKNCKPLVLLLLPADYSLKPWRILENQRHHLQPQSSEHLCHCVTSLTWVIPLAVCKVRAILMVHLTKVEVIYDFWFMDTISLLGQSCKILIGNTQNPTGETLHWGSWTLRKPSKAQDQHYLFSSIWITLNNELGPDSVKHLSICLILNTYLSALLNWHLKK